MAVTITEIAKVGTSSGGNGGGAPIIDAASVKGQQTLTVDGDASAAFAPGTSYVEVDSDTNCRVEFGAAPDGEGVTFLIPAGTPRQFAVAPNSKAFATAA